MSIVVPEITHCKQCGVKLGIDTDHICNCHKTQPKKLKLIDVLNLMAEGKLKEGTKVIIEYVEHELIKIPPITEDDVERYDLFDKEGHSIFESYRLSTIEEEVELIEPGNIKPIEKIGYAKLENLEDPSINESWLKSCILEDKNKINELVEHINELEKKIKGK